LHLGFSGGILVQSSQKKRKRRERLGGDGTTFRMEVQGAGCGSHGTLVVKYGPQVWTHRFSDQIHGFRALAQVLGTVVMCEVLDCRQVERMGSEHGRKIRESDMPRGEDGDPSPKVQFLQELKHAFFA